MLEFAQLELACIPMSCNPRHARLFGVISAALPRHVTANDRWIAAAAAADGHHLVTQDRALAERLAEALADGPVHDAAAPGTTVTYCPSVDG